jgi:hypothetical protein
MIVLAGGFSLLDRIIADCGVELEAIEGLSS